MKRKPPRNKAKRPSANLAGALFSGTQGRVLGLLFGQPGRSFYANEVVRVAGGGSGAVQRELARLSDAGLVTVKRIGNQKHFQVNEASPIYGELRGIVMKTVGLVDVLRAALATLEDRIEAAFVYGSVAKASDTAMSDIDLMLVGDLTVGEVIEALLPAEAQLGRKLSPVVYSRKELRRKLAEGNAFLKRVMEQPRLLIAGMDNGFG